MKNLWLHGIYLSIIGVLCFQLWSKTVATRVAFEQIGEVLKSNYAFFDMHSTYLFQDIEKQIETNPLRYKPYFLGAEQLKEGSKLVNNFIDNMLKNVQNHVNLDLNIIKDSLNFYSKSLTNIDDPKDRLSLIKLSCLLKTIQNDTFWSTFKENEQTHLLLLKNQFHLDEILYLTYIQDKVTFRSCGITEVLCVAIAPKQASLIEGEKLEAQIYLSQFVSSNIDSTITFLVDNKELPIKDGMAYFSKRETKIGLKTLKVQAIIRNPITGYLTKTEAEFEYHVLPKCSKNCQ